MAHLLGLALVTYAKIANIFTESQLGAPDPNDSRISPEAASRKFLMGYQTLDFCKVMHASRSHSLAFSNKHFEKMIASSYYDAHLRSPLMSIRCIFETHQPWQGSAHQKSFVESELFLPQFFRNLMGCFSTNTLEVIVGGVIRGSALFTIYSKMNHDCCKNTVNVDCEAASVRVFAAHDISTGDEITTTYRFDESECSSPAQAYIVRRRALDQYLFRCGVESGANAIFERDRESHVFQVQMQALCTTFV